MSGKKEDKLMQETEAEEIERAGLCANAKEHGSLRWF